MSLHHNPGFFQSFGKRFRIGFCGVYLSGDRRLRVVGLHKTCSFLLIQNFKQLFYQPSRMTVKGRQVFHRIFLRDGGQMIHAALKTAQNALKSKNQKTIDKAAAGLKEAIAALVKMDYMILTAAIDAGKALLVDEAGGALWAELGSALTEAMELLNCGDQAKVDAAAQRLVDAVSAVQRYLAQKDDDTPEETLPAPTIPNEVGQRCDYPNHKVWPVMFWVSLALNIVFIVLIVTYIVAKAKNRKDTTPLVEYDIEDDDE